MEQVKNARFQFKRYRILKSYIEINESTIDSSDLSMMVEMEPAIELKTEEGIFNLLLKVHVYDEKNIIDMSFDIKGYYKYDKNCDRDCLRSFLTRNAPAILFPYLRAYITNLTSLSGIQPIILPTYNMTGIGQKGGSIS